MTQASNRRHLRRIAAKAAAIAIVLAAAISVMTAQTPENRRRMTPVNNAATATQAINETKNDTARINAARRASSTHYHDDQGRIIFVDTITGEQWIDSTAMFRVPKMKFPLLHSMSVSVNIWDPVMRIFGQHYGILDAAVEANLHNRYISVFEAGLGKADYTPSDGNFTYRSPLSFYFRLGANYNFLFNSNPNYMFTAGLRYGFSPFSYSVDNVTVDSPYWDESSTFNIPAQHATAGWLEFTLGLRVRLWGPISAGWSFKFHTLIHESRATYGKPWYIPGYGTRNGAITGSFSITYTLPLSGLNKKASDAVIESDADMAPATEAQPVSLHD